MQQHKNYILAGAIVAMLVAPNAFATNGNFSHGYSVNKKALAGVA